MRKSHRWLYPNHLVYLLAHGVLFLIGIVFVLANKDSPLLSAIGVGIISTGIAGWVIFAYVLVSQRTNQKLDLLTDFGILDAFEMRGMKIKEEYDKRIDKAHRIDIIGFGLRALRQDYRDEFEQWIQHASVRILLLDPEFPNAQNAYSIQRDVEEENAAGTIKSDVNEFISACTNLLDGNGVNKFEIRLYRCLPSVNIFRIDDELFWGPYLMKEQSRNSPTFLVRRGGILYDRLSRHFEEIWKDDSISVPAKNENSGASQ